MQDCFYRTLPKQRPRRPPYINTAKLSPIPALIHSRTAVSTTYGDSQLVRSSRGEVSGSGTPEQGGSNQQPSGCLPEHVLLRTGDVPNHKLIGPSRGQQSDVSGQTTCLSNARATLVDKPPFCQTPERLWWTDHLSVKRQSDVSGQTTCQSTPERR